MKLATGVRVLAALTLAVTVSGCMLTGGRHGSPLLSVGFIMREPPPERVEVIGERPYTEAVWIGGHWAESHGDYVWVNGRWERPEAGRHEWVNGRWEHEERGWHYSDGHWR
jgi:hypothetical protein